MKRLRGLLPSAGLLLLLLAAGCRTLPPALQEPDSLELLPSGAGAYTLLVPPQLPAFSAALSRAATQEEQRELVALLTERSEEIAFANNADGSVAVAALGRFPRGSLRWSLARNAEWEKRSLRHETTELPYWYNARIPAELVIPRRGIAAAAFGGAPGRTAQRLLDPPEEPAIPRAVAAGMRSAGLAVYSDDPWSFLRRGLQTARRAPGSDGAPGTDRGGAAPTVGAPSEIFSALRGAPQERIMSSVESFLLLINASTHEQASERGGEGEQMLSASVQLGFESERAARVSLVVLRLSVLNLVAELERLRVAPDNATRAEPPAVERSGAQLVVGPIELRAAGLARVSLPLFAPLSYH